MVVGGDYEMMNLQEEGQLEECQPLPFTLDQRRRAALAEVDNATFSYATFNLSLRIPTRAC